MKCKSENLCDARYILREWFFRTVILSLLTVGSGAGSIIYFVGKWTTKTDMDVSAISSRVDNMQLQINELKHVQSNIDTLKVWLRPK